MFQPIKSDPDFLSVLIGKKYYKNDLCLTDIGQVRFRNIQSRIFIKKRNVRSGVLIYLIKGE